MFRRLVLLLVGVSALTLGFGFGYWSLNTVGVLTTSKTISAVQVIDVTPDSLSDDGYNAGATHAAYTTFYNRYGISIAADIAGNTVPTGTDPDIGAYEE